MKTKVEKKSDNQNNQDNLNINEIKQLLDIVKNYREELDWVLYQQSKLRIEFLTFLKKDINEIISSQGLFKSFFRKRYDRDAINEIVKSYKDDIEESQKIIDAKYINLIRNH